MKRAFKLVLGILLCQLAGLVGSLFTTAAIPNWYANLNKPSFSPPNWIFAPVWISLYTLMGISLSLIWSQGLGKKQIKRAVYLFLVHLVFNSLWSVIFFGMKNPLLAFGEILILWGMILALIFVFFRINKLASLLLVPYFLWVSFAAVLNFSIWQLNR